MRRTMIPLGIIALSILLVVSLDLWFMTGFAMKMDRQLDLIEDAGDLEERKAAALEMDAYFKEKSFIAHRLVPTDRLDELGILLHKLNAYIQTEDEHETMATTAEIRAKINTMYSTWIYRWYHPEEFCIE